MDCLLSAEAVAIDGRPCALWAMQDVTERRRTEAELATAIEAVMRDTSWFSRTVLEKLAKLRRPDLGEASVEGVADLTPRGREVLGLVCRGLDDGAIAERLGLSRTTVRNHVNDLYRRTTPAAAPPSSSGRASAASPARSRTALERRGAVPADRRRWVHCINPFGARGSFQRSWIRTRRPRGTGGFSRSLPGARSAFDGRPGGGHRADTPSAAHRRTPMDKDRVAGAAKQVKGSVKEAIGKVIGDTETQAEGAAEKAVGKAQNTAGGAKDAVRDAADK
jgi:uncharacterized protein YjbJ (UPF0337 family)/DNA-binding CsgD family transcriptional regulator